MSGRILQWFMTPDSNISGYFKITQIEYIVLKKILASQCVGLLRNIRIRSLTLPQKKATTYKCYETTTKLQNKCTRNQLKTKQLDSLSHNTSCVADRENSFAKRTRGARGGDATRRRVCAGRNNRAIGAWINMAAGAAPPRQNRKPLSPADCYRLDRDQSECINILQTPREPLAWLHSDDSALEI